MVLITGAATASCDNNPIVKAIATLSNIARTAAAV